MEDNKHSVFSDAEIDRIIGMAWEDRTPFEAIDAQFGLKEAAVITLMRKHLLPNSFKRWRKRVKGRSTKHGSLQNRETLRFKSVAQKQITLNRISKRS